MAVLASDVQLSKVAATTAYGLKPEDLFCVLFMERTSTNSDIDHLVTGTEGVMQADMGCVAEEEFVQFRGNEAGKGGGSGYGSHVKSSHQSEDWFEHNSALVGMVLLEVVCRCLPPTFELSYPARGTYSLTWIPNHGATRHFSHQQTLPEMKDVESDR